MTSHPQKRKPAWDPFAKLAREETKMNLTLQSATAKLSENTEINAKFSITTDEKPQFEQKKVQWIEFPSKDNAKAKAKGKTKRNILVRNSMAPLDKLAKIRKSSTHSILKSPAEPRKLRKRRKSNLSRETLSGKKRDKDRNVKESKPDNASNDENETEEVNVSLWNRYKKEKANNIDGLVREVINRAINDTDGMYAKRMILKADQNDPFYMFTKPEEANKANKEATTKTAPLRSSLKKPPANEVECLVEQALERKEPLKTILKQTGPLSGDKSSTVIEEDIYGVRLKKLKSTELETLIKEAKHRQTLRNKAKAKALALLKKLSQQGDPEATEKLKKRASMKLIGDYWPRRRKRRNASMKALFTNSPATKVAKQETKRMPRIRRTDPMDQTVLKAIESSSTVTRHRELSLRRRDESKTSLKRREPQLYVQYHQKSHLQFRKRRRVKKPSPDPGDKEKEKKNEMSVEDKTNKSSSSTHKEKACLDTVIAVKEAKKVSNPVLRKMDKKFLTSTLVSKDILTSHNEEAIEEKPVVIYNSEQEIPKKPQKTQKTPRKKGEKAPKKIRKRRKRLSKAKTADVPKIDSKTSIVNQDREPSSITVVSKKESATPDEVSEVPQTWYSDYLENVIVEGNSRLQKLDNAMSVVQVLNTFVKFQKRAKEAGNLEAQPQTSKPNYIRCKVGIVALDCVMVGTGYLGKKDMLGKVTIVGQNGDILLDKFVKPREPVTNYRSEVTGIQPIDFVNAEDYDKVRRTVIGLLKGKILVGHEVSRKLEVLNIKHPYVKIRDTARYRPLAWIVSNGQTTGLNKISYAILGKSVHVGKHNSVEEARAIMNIYNCLSPGWEEYIKHSRVIKSK